MEVGTYENEGWNQGRPSAFIISTSELFSILSTSSQTFVVSVMCRILSTSLSTRCECAGGYVVLSSV